MKSVKKVRVKFCGMTRVQDIENAEKCGADFLGLIFVRSSPRFVNLEKAHRLRKHVLNARVVGVCEEIEVAEIESIARSVGLDYVQLYDEVAPSTIARMTVPVIKAFREIPTIGELTAYLRVCPYILIDKPLNKHHPDFMKIASLPQSIRDVMFVSGGLDVGNVADVAKQTEPFAVDVARGIEISSGIKDEGLMHAFIHQ